MKKLGIPSSDKQKSVHHRGHWGGGGVKISQCQQERRDYHYLHSCTKKKPWIWSGTACGEMKCRAEVRSVFMLVYGRGSAA